MSLTTSQKEFGRFIQGQGSAAVAVLNTAVPLSSAPLWVSWCRIKAVKPSKGGANSGIVYLGHGAHAADNYPLAVGEVFDLTPFEVGLIDLSQVFISGAATDGVVYEYQQPAAFNQ
jgi:hypothetical protein